MQLEVIDIVVLMGLSMFLLVLMGLSMFLLLPIVIYSIYQCARLEKEKKDRQYLEEQSKKKRIYSKWIKTLVLNIGIGVVDTIIFSPGLLGIDIIGSSALEMSFGATIIFMSIIVFIYGNYKLIIEKEKIIQADEIETTEDCIDALNQNYDKRIFQKDVAIILEQIEMFQKKREAIKEVLLQKFDITEMSYSKFDEVISDIENIFYMNIRSIINKLNAFDEKDYNRIKKYGDKKFSNELIRTKMHIYDEYISFVKEAIEDNEHIILKLDKILLELTKFNSLEGVKIEDMSAMKEMDDLINKVKLYD